MLTGEGAEMSVRKKGRLEGRSSPDGAGRGAARYLLMAEEGMLRVSNTIGKLSVGKGGGKTISSLYNYFTRAMPHSEEGRGWSRGGGSQFLWGKRLRAEEEKERKLVSLQEGSQTSTSGGKTAFDRGREKKLRETSVVSAFSL